MSIHVSGGGATRRVVLSCDVAGCPVQAEPPPAERWRSAADARSWARSRAEGWTYDPTRGTDYCPDHVAFSTPPPSGALPPRPTAAVLDQAGNPLNRDDYAAGLRSRLAGPDSEERFVLTAGQADVTARLLEELAGVYQGEELGALAGELAALLSGRTSSSD
jgi:hypothetical protein